MLFGAFVQGKSAIENQPSSSLPGLGRDDQEGFLQPGLGTNYLFKHLVNTWRGAHLPAARWLSGAGAAGPHWGPPRAPLCSPRPGHCNHRCKKMFTARAGVISSPQGRSVCLFSFLPSFLSTLMLISCTRWPISKRCFTDPKAEGGETASKSHLTLALLSEHKSLQVVFTEDSYSL